MRILSGKYKNVLFHCLLLPTLGCFGGNADTSDSLDQQANEYEQANNETSAQYKIISRNGNKVTILADLEEEKELLTGSVAPFVQSATNYQYNQAKANAVRHSKLPIADDKSPKSVFVNNILYVKTAKLTLFESYPDKRFTMSVGVFYFGKPPIVNGSMKFYLTWEFKYEPLSNPNQ